MNNEQKLKTLFDYYQNRKYNEAVDLAEIIIGNSSDNAFSWKVLGSSLKELGRLEESLDANKKVTELTPHDASAYFNLGNIYRELARLKEAELSYIKAIELKPEYQTAYYNLAISYLEMHNYEEAIKFFKISNYGDYQTYILRCYFELGEKLKFNTQLDDVIKNGIVNPVIGSFIMRSEIRDGIKRENIFAEKPFDLITKRNLSKLYDFKEFFDETVRILKEKSTRYKNQELLVNGDQTLGNIFRTNIKIISDFEKIILSEIENYRKKFISSEQGFIKYWPNKFSLNGWIINMKNGGKLRPHIHESGWISGAVYIHVPEKKFENSGNFVLCYDDAEHEEIFKESENKIIDVITGDIVLFPSSLMHYTIPFESFKERIVLAFDLIPE
tara:strand:+ start:574 stop:1731 length:1158 start_codon:yes stop_codon:yes gene_type:complete